MCSQRRSIGRRRQVQSLFNSGKRILWGGCGNGGEDRGWGDGGGGREGCLTRAHVPTWVCDDDIHGWMVSFWQLDRNNTTQSKVVWVCGWVCLGWFQNSEIPCRCVLRCRRQFTTPARLKVNKGSDNRQSGSNQFGFRIPRRQCHANANAKCKHVTYDIHVSMPMPMPMPMHMHVDPNLEIWIRVSQSPHQRKGYQLLIHASMVISTPPRAHQIPAPVFQPQLNRRQRNLHLLTTLQAVRICIKTHPAFRTVEVHCFTSHIMPKDKLEHCYWLMYKPMLSCPHECMFYSITEFRNSQVGE